MLAFDPRLPLEAGGFGGIRLELINCHDCDRPVSFTAADCPNCGSREPRGPYRHNRNEARRIGIEGRNDTRLILMTVGFGAIGVFYGIETSATYGQLGVWRPLRPQSVGRFSAPCFRFEWLPRINSAPPLPT